MGMPFLCRALSESKSKTQLELSAAGTCRIFSESRCKRWLELVQQVHVEYLVKADVRDGLN